jgi:hypothetical protein
MQIPGCDSQNRNHQCKYEYKDNKQRKFGPAAESRPEAFEFSLQREFDIIRLKDAPALTPERLILFLGGFLIDQFDDSGIITPAFGAFFFVKRVCMTAGRAFFHLKHLKQFFKQRTGQFANALFCDSPLL